VELPTNSTTKADSAEAGRQISGARLAFDDYRKRSPRGGRGAGKPMVDLVTDDPWSTRRSSAFRGLRPTLALLLRRR
jgi:hypothetical protein